MTTIRLTALGCLGLALTGCGGGTKAPAKISEFGRYEGYSEAPYSEWVRTSEYVTMPDGVRLAVDVIRPAQNGVAVDRKFPVVWTYSRYHRTPPPEEAVAASHDVTAVRAGHQPTGPGPDFSKPDSTGKVPHSTAPSIVDENAGYQRLVKHGYVIVSVQVRGGGASFGRYQGLFSPAETRDAYDLMNWMVKQSWCDGNLGMAGGSYLGITQYMAASTRHPALKAIFPRIAAFDLYDFFYAGGIYRENAIQHWGLLTRSLDVDFPEPPVQGDSLGTLRAAALAEHADNWNVIDQFRAARFRDHDIPAFSYGRHSPSARLDSINQSGVAAYHFGGWFDVFAKDEMLWFANWTGTDRVTMGPWSHDFPDPASAAEVRRLTPSEQHRWFDRWLKGIRNGIDSEPPVRYALMTEPGKWIWKTADRWPPREVENTTYYFDAGPSGSARSVNDGLLTPAKPSVAGSDRYQVDTTTTTGSATRWDNAVAQGPMVYPDLAPNDAKALTYTTAPLAADLAVVGHPVVTLVVSTDRADGDFYAILTEVDNSGFSRYVTEGMQRVSLRDTATAPWDNLGLPWHRGYRADAKPVTQGQIVTLSFDLQPTATVFNAGHRLRVTITGADADNTERAPITGRPTIQLYRGGDRPSGIQLPILR